MTILSAALPPVLEPVSVALKFGFIAVLYIFLIWVVRSSFRDLRGAGATAQVISDGTAMHAASEGLGRSATVTGEPRLEVERAPGHESGVAYDLLDGALLGRGEDVDIRLEDPFASSHHARIVRQGGLYVLEDLGSTNGTLLNGEPVRGPQPLHVGDRIKIGDSEFSYVC